MKTFRDFIFEKLGRMRIVMLGGPGSGKSTYTEYLIKHFNITHIYPGGMLRKEVEKIHPYDVPCIMKFDVEANTSYENWIRDSVELKS